ncbi:MAG: hypothetical protein ACLQPD_26180 [Desulfomonilaceae bacterium]
MKKLISVLLCLACISMLMAPAHAWEFKMTGSMNWVYQFANQSGDKGFFGPYNVDVDNAGQTSNLNFWWGGYLVSQNLVTGKTGAGTYLWVILDPVITINPAIKLYSELHVGQWADPQNATYFTQDAPGTSNAMGEIQVTQLWATAQLPWGTFGFGKRPWKFGTGLQYDGSDALSTESLILNSAYGPLDIGIGMYAHRPARRCATIPQPNIANLLSPINTLDPYDLVIFGVQPYFNFGDNSGVLAYDTLAYTVYNNGPTQVGILGAFSSYHIGPEGFLRTLSGGVPLPTPNRTLDSNFLHGTAFVKYNNGRFFFNSEAAWLYWNDRVTGPGVLALPDDAAVAAFVTATNYAAPLFYPPTFTPSSRYTEQWRYMAEAGIFCGPSRLSFLYAWSPGPDRRNGQLIDRQPAAFVWHPTFDTFLGNYDVFRPYSFIFTYNYGSGFDAYNLSLDGYLRDAEVLAARFDYAVASNLNLYGSFMYADRTSHGYGWGCLSPLVHTTAGFGNPDNVDGNVHFNLNGNTGNVLPLATPPNIPDTALGWEVDAGLDWALLEGFKTGVLVGYWQPGKWFSYACVDRSVPFWRTAPGPANNWGTRPDKTIDSIVAGQVTMTLSF